jgi:Tfp pilus assembly protein PilO
MPSIEEQFKELQKFTVTVLEATNKRIAELEEDHNYLLRAFLQMHPDLFADLERNKSATSLGFAAFLRTHPETLKDLDRVEAVVGRDQPDKKP